jgi:hypothetical protein
MPSLDARGKMKLPRTMRFLWVLSQLGQEARLLEGFCFFNFA